MSAAWITGLDLESTGLDVTKDRIVEFAFVWLDEETSEPRRISRRVNPGVHIPARAVAVHGITDADVLRANSFADWAPAIAKILARTKTLVVHNGESFDLPLLNNELIRAGVTPPDAPSVLDTALRGRWATADGKMPTLGELCWSLDVPYDPASAHGALYDTEVMMNCWRRAEDLGLWTSPNPSLTRK